jgi:polar amino acid transport system substrate-binding protein
MQRPAALALLLTFAATPAAADTVTIRVGSWCPYVCEPGSERPGYLIEIARRVFGENGHAIDHRELPLPRAIALVRDGSYDAVASIGRDDAPDLVFSQPMGLHVTGLALRRGSGFRFEGVRSLETLRLGSSIGAASWGAGLDAYIAANRDDPERIDLTGGERTYEVQIRKLLAGRIDAIANNTIVLAWLAREMGVANRIEIVEIARNDDVYFAFAPGAPRSADYARLLDEGVARLRASGELAAIMARYGLPDWEP